MEATEDKHMVGEEDMTMPVSNRHDGRKIRERKAEAIQDESIGRVGPDVAGLNQHHEEQTWSSTAHAIEDERMFEGREDNFAQPAQRTEELEKNS